MVKYLVYEAFIPPYERPVWQAVEADGLHGLMNGVAPESRVYSWWADSSDTAINQVKAFVKEH